MAKDRSTAGLGDTVELADKETSFYDPETQMHLSRENTAVLTDRIGKKTHTALVSGRLLVVGKKQRMLGASDTAAETPAKGGKKAAANKEAE